MAWSTNESCGFVLVVLGASRFQDHVKAGSQHALESSPPPAAPPPPVCLLPPPPIAVAFGAVASGVFELIGTGRVSVRCVMAFASDVARLTLGSSMMASY